MAIEDWDAATKEEILDEYAEDIRTLKKLEQTDNTKKEFFAARRIALDALSTTHDAAMDVLKATWQAGEDNDYTIPQ